MFHMLTASISVYKMAVRSYTQPNLAGLTSQMSSEPPMFSLAVEGIVFIHRGDARFVRDFCCLLSISKLL